MFAMHILGAVLAPVVGSTVASSKSHTFKRLVSSDACARAGGTGMLLEAQKFDTEGYALS